MSHLRGCRYLGSSLWFATGSNGDRDGHCSAVALDVLILLVSRCRGRVDFYNRLDSAKRIAPALSMQKSTMSTTTARYERYIEATTTRNSPTGIAQDDGANVARLIPQFMLRCASSDSNTAALSSSILVAALYRQKLRCKLRYTHTRTLLTFLCCVSSRARMAPNTVCIGLRGSDKLEGTMRGVCGDRKRDHSERQMGAVDLTCS